MSEVRTTVSLQEDLYTGIKVNYKQLGFTRMGDLINEAVRDYLHRRRIEGMHRSMERAAADPDYRRLLKEVSEDFRVVDAEGLPEY